MDFQYWWVLTKALADGLVVSVELFAVVLVCSLPLGLLITLVARSRVAPLRVLAQAYIYVIRGTPLLLQLFFIYFGVKIIYTNITGDMLNMGRMTAAMLGFVFNYAAYFAEIFRGGFLAIDKGQYEASKVLGLSRFQTLTRVIFPQMFRVALPSVTNESVTLVKDTSLLYAVSVPEILHYARVAVNRDSDITAFIIAAAIYLIFNTLVTLAFKFIEKKADY